MADAGPSPGADGRDAAYPVRVGGAGPPVLLLHGFPQDHTCAGGASPRRSRERHTVVACDLRGYGASTAPRGGPRGEGYTKREMAAELVAGDGGLGHERFAVVGHDRGARVALPDGARPPGRRRPAGVLNVIPTIDQFARMSTGTSLGTGRGAARAARADARTAPERRPGAVLDHVFATWPADPAAIDPDHRAAYLRR